MRMFLFWSKFSSGHILFCITIILILRVHPSFKFLKMRHISRYTSLLVFGSYHCSFPLNETVSNFEENLFLYCWFASTKSPTAMSLSFVRLRLSMYSFLYFWAFSSFSQAILFLFTMPFRLSVGSLPRTGLLNNNSHGAILVVECGVVRYWRRNRCISCFQTFPSTIAA